MSLSTAPDLQEILSSAHYRPAVSIIMPFEPKMSIKAELEQQLKFVVDKVEKQLEKDYNSDLTDLVILKLKKIIRALNFSTYKKSIAIFVSPVFEKIFYLDIEVEEKVIIDDSFEIRDLIYAKKEVQKYMILVLSSKKTNAYVHTSSSFMKVKSNVPDRIAAFEHDLPERTGNFSDPAHHKEILLNKFLHETDHGLSFLLKAYPLPVFIMGNTRVLGHFKKITSNAKSILGYVEGNYDESTEAELDIALKPYILDWKRLKTEALFQEMEKAAGADKLAKGIVDVWKEVARHKGHLLIIEKNFMFTAERGSEEETICKPAEPYNKFSCIKDAVDDLIEKVLQDGGDVEFVEDGSLKNFDHIALIQYY